MHAGEAVSADRLLDEVWGERLPETGKRAVAYQIGKLRSALEPDRDGAGSLISTTAAGYRLEVAPNDVDAHRFERLVGEACARVGSDPARAEALALEAVALWRGGPFADLGDEPFVERWTRRLDGQHLTARRTLAEARVGLGRADEVIAELDALVAEQPLDEALVGLSMTALHATGRTADALRAYGELRRLLAVELGVEPSRQLQRLEQQLLIGDTTAPAPRLVADSATPRSSRPVPAAASSFVGRTAELAELPDWLASTRLVTICGIGGIGKTRLVQQLAPMIADRFPDGIWYVDLAPITDPTIVADTITAAAGLTTPVGRDPTDLLIDHLAGRATLVILDNCEQLAGPVAELTGTLLAAVPNLRILATSRTPLDARDEAIYPLHPLDPDTALRLFVDRARVARPGFTLDDANRPAIADLATHLDGIPLAIELAAARLAALSSDQLAGYQDHLLDVLTNIRPHPDPRRYSLTAVIDWSYQLLDPTDRQLLRRLTVCAGGFDLDAAHAIGPLDPNTTPTDTLDHLTHLVHVALIDFDTTHPTPRYRLLEPVRQHLESDLTREERDDAALAHAQHYETVAITLSQLWPTDPLAIRQLGDRELANLRAAMLWAYQHDHPRLGLAIASRAYRYFLTTQLDREFLKWVRIGLHVVDDDDDDTLTAAAYASHAAANLADLEAHDALFPRIHRSLDATLDPRLRAELLAALGSLAIATDPGASAAYTQAAIEIRGSTPARAWASLNNRIDQSWLSGNLPDGPNLLRRVGELEREGPLIPWGVKIRAGVAACQGRWEDVLDLAESATDAEPVVETSMRTLQAEALGALGQSDEALTLIATVDPDSYEQHHGCIDRVRAAIELRRSRPDAAIDHLRPLIDQITRDGRKLANGMHVASLLAVAATDLGQHDTAAILLGHAAAEQERLNIVLRPSDQPLIDRATHTCRTTLGPNGYDQLAAQGAITTWSDLPRIDLPPDEPESSRRPPNPSERRPHGTIRTTR